MQKDHAHRGSGFLIRGCPTQICLWGSQTVVMFDHFGTWALCYIPRFASSLGVSDQAGIFHQAELPNRGRRVRLWLTAVPMGAAAIAVAVPFSEQMRTEAA